MSYPARGPSMGIDGKAIAAKPPTVPSSESIRPCGGGRMITPARGPSMGIDGNRVVATP